MTKRWTDSELQVYENFIIATSSFPVDIVFILSFHTIN